MHTKKSLSLKIYSVGFMILGVVVLYFSSGNSASVGVGDGIQMCLNVVIPSLFPFMVISTFIVESGLISLISRPLSHFSRKILRLNPDTGAVFFMSLIGGYPTGAKMISTLVQQNKLSEKDAKRIIPFCINAGPGFIITAVGANIFGKTNIGLYLFLSQTITSIILAILSGFIFGEKIDRITNQKPQTNQPILSNSFVSSVVSSAGALFNISAFVTIFSGIIAMLRHAGIIDSVASALANIFTFSNPDKIFFTTLINGMFEIVQGCVESVKIPGVLGCYVCCFFLSFGSFSILFQVLSCAKNVGVKLSGIIVQRLIHGGVSIGILWGLFRLFPQSAYVLASSDAQNVRAVLSGSPEASAMLFFLCSFLLFSLGNPPKKT